MTPGILWIDDFHIRGETTSRSARLNAQRTLLAALQAYREQRYADFARLAGSHWIRESAMTTSGRLARTNDLPADGERWAYQAIDRPTASALPPDSEAQVMISWTRRSVDSG